MNKFKLLVAMLCLILVGCSNQESEPHHADSKNHEKKQNQKNEDKHNKTVKNGVTYIDEILVVNKDISLPAHFNPGENEVAREALHKFLNDGNKKGYHLSSASGFRSYQTQEQLFNRYVQRDGKAAANKYSAKPGHSEHQTGLTYDIVSENTDTNFKTSFGKTEEGQWIKHNAHKYGFIIRYPKGKTHITGYQYEPWHIRYVGKDTAKALYNHSETLEEYLDLYPK
ncbi:M15 family metallopeptidase [Staphylococcus sp. GDY8P120P]|uniref:M15 family metallopeptidase n=1 Tax=Staphylococcus sp. GDY8P120P TaxID=2804156 RepID=UPI001AEBA935|nr:M15 family metallopeptidase [Staphylococcus sp. GDY8P120P]